MIPSGIPREPLLPPSTFRRGAGIAPRDDVARRPQRREGAVRGAERQQRAALEPQGHVAWRRCVAVGVQEEDETHGSIGLYF